MTGKSFRFLLIRFVFVVLLCSASIFVMNLYTSTWYTNKAIFTVLMRNGGDVFTTRKITEIKATTIPNDTLHDWWENKGSAVSWKIEATTIPNDTLYDWQENKESAISWKIEATTIPNDTLYDWQENKESAISWKIEATTIPNDVLLNWREKDESAVGIYILSAIGSNTSEHKGFKADIKLSGWETSTNTKIRCCILLNSGVVATFNQPRRVFGKEGAILSAYQYECPVNTSIYNVRGVTIQFAQSKCTKNNDRYIQPYIPKKILTEESFAICLKLLYGNVDHTNLIDWLEYNREIGVDKVFMFTYNLTEATRNVLKPYIKLGYVETRPFAYPLNTTRRVGEKSKSAWTDEQVVVFDCLQRLSGYKYMAIVDLDEFLVPRKHKDVKRMMKYLMMKYPAAGGFTLSSYLFLKDVKPASNITGNISDIMRYFTRTPGLIGKASRMKNIVLPTRITAEGYHTHKFKSRPGYRRVKVQTDVASMNHYRNCYEDQTEFCSKDLKTDTYILKFVERFRNRTSQIG